MKGLVFTNHVGETIDAEVEALNPSVVVVISDANTHALVLPRLMAESKAVAAAKQIEIKAGDMNKNLDTLGSVWKSLGEHGVTRSALVINLGGGVVTDLGGFAASTYMRGVNYINVPTTLLGAVDASLGGKTGINFGGFKNRIGVFSDAVKVIISTTFFRTLTSSDLLSGYGEMVKHAMLSSQTMVHKLLQYDVTNYDPDRLLELIEESVRVKARYVAADHDETFLRRALNLGHTFGHAFESLAMKRLSPLPHGYAVAYGLLPAMILSHIKLGFPTEEIHRYASFIAERYGAFEIACTDYPQLIEFMHGDKKNRTADGTVSCVLLKEYGEPELAVEATEADITAALDLYRDFLKLP